MNVILAVLSACTFVSFSWSAEIGKSSEKSSEKATEKKVEVKTESVIAFEKAESLWNNRAAEAKGEWVSIDYMNKLISQIQIAIKDPALEEKSAVFLLKASYFKGAHAAKKKSEKMKIYDNAKSKAERFKKKYSKNPAMHYWYAVNLGLWAQEYGAISAVKEGVAEKLRDALDAKGHPYEWLIKNKEGHGFYDEDNILEANTKILSFLEKHIGT